MKITVTLFILSTLAPFILNSSFSSGFKIRSDFYTKDGQGKRRGFDFFLEKV